MISLGDSFGWPFRDGSWVSKVLLQGLILIIPIIGWIALAGWILESLDNVRNGRQELAPAGFPLGRGFQLFIVELVYYLVAGIPAWVLFGIGGAVSQQSTGGGGALIGIAYLYQAVASLFILFLSPAILVSTYRGGISGGLSIGSVWALATANATNSILAALVFLVASIISYLGLILCFIGVLFTTVYAGAVVAGAAAWFDQVTLGRQATPAPGPTS
jgi:Protein of unknown function (DUF4013)